VDSSLPIPRLQKTLRDCQEVKIQVYIYCETGFAMLRKRHISIQEMGDGSGGE